LISVRYLIGKEEQYNRAIITGGVKMRNRGETQGKMKGEKTHKNKENHGTNFQNTQKKQFMWELK
jgi:hypothetical protein